MNMIEDAARVAAARAEAAGLVASLTGRLDAVIEASAWSANDDEHDPEGATVAFERAQVAGLLARAREELRALDAAAGRVENGTYGRCERCGGAIPADRLAALPAVTTCIRCADHR